MENTKIKTIWDYFEDNIDYPNNIMENPIPYNICWSYVSSTFLNGFINYVEPIKVFVIDRYSSNKEEVTCEQFKGTKRELKDKIISGDIKPFHTDLGCFNDDIMILAEFEHEKDELNHFIYFWFDCDVSDCVIGKFKTEDTKEQVIQSLVNFLEQRKEENKDFEIEEHMDNGILNYTELPLSFLNGWLKF